MATDLQIVANRQNSQKSTGPRSVAGKLVSSQNALKSGIYSEAEIIRGESRADLDALTASYMSYYQPQAPAEAALVDILIHSEWLLRRFRRADAQMWNVNMESQSDNSFSEDFPLGVALDADAQNSFPRLQRRIDSTQRNFQRALKDLTHLQSNRPTPQPIEKMGPASELGFVPSNAPEAPPIPAAIGFVPSLAPKASPEPLAPKAPLAILTPYSLLLTSPSPSPTHQPASAPMLKSTKSSSPMPDPDRH